MSSKTIDERVVQMQFDNTRFEKNVQQSMGTIDKLKKKLNFKDSVKNMETLENETANVSKSFNKVSDSIDDVDKKLINFKNIFKIELLERISNKLLDTVEKTVKSLTIEPITAGWSKYEEKITSVQTIMSATASTWEANAKAIGFAGTQMEFVNAQLDKLNWFSDETSFSFTDMTSNIGKFTSAGVDLDKAVTAMEGISVWAAKSGQNAQSASRAYYNLAQAMSVGSVKLMDWKSIENANMATMEFKQTAIETAEKLKYLKKVEDGVWKTVKGHTVTVENFNQELSDGWFSAEVLMETLEEYGKAATKLSEISEEYGITTTRFLGSLEDYQNGEKEIGDIARELGMSVEELLPLFKELSSEEYKLSLSAFKAAQEAKTFKEVIDATKDAVSTGWMNTFEIIFGNYEEAKKLWSEMAEGFYNIFAEGGNNRNNILTAAMDSSFDKLMSKISAAGISSEAFGERLTKILKENGVPIDELIKKWGSLEEAMRHIDNIKEYVIQAIESFIKPISDGAGAILDATGKLEEFQKVVNQVIRGEFKSGKTRVEKLTEAGYNYALVQGLVNKVWEKNNHTWKDTTITAEDLAEVISKLSDEELASIGMTKDQADMLQKLAEEARETGSDLDELLNGLSQKSGRELLHGSLLNFIEAINIALDSMRNSFYEVFSMEDIAKGIHKFLEAIYKFSEWLKMDEKQAVKFSKAFKGVLNIISILGDVLGSLIKVFFPAFSKGLNLGVDGIFGILAAFGDWTEKVREFFSESNFFVRFFSEVKDAISSGIDALRRWIKGFLDIPVVGKVFKKVYDTIKKFTEIVGGYLTSLKILITGYPIKISEAFSRVFNTIKKDLANFINNTPALSKIKDILVKIVDKIKSIADNIGSGFMTGLKNVGTNILNAIKKFVKKCLDKINEMLGIHSPSKWFIDLVWNCAKGIAVGIVEVTKFVVSKIRQFIKFIFDSIRGTIDSNDPKESIIDRIRTVWKESGGIRGKIVEIFDAIVETLKRFGEKIKEAVSKVVGYLKSLSKDELKELLMDILNMVLIIAKIKAAFGVASGFSNMGKAFKTMGDSIAGFFDSFKKKNIGVTAVLFASAIAILVGAIIALSRLGGENLDQAADVIGTIILIFGAIVALILKLDKMSVVGKGMKAVGHGDMVRSMAVLLLSIAATIFILMQSLGKYMDLSKASSDEKLQGILGNMVVFIFAMMTLVELFGLLNSRVGKKNIGFKAVSSILAIAIGIRLILGTIEKYFFKKDVSGNLIYDAEKVSNIAEAFIIVGEMIVVLGGVLAMIAAASGPRGLKGATTTILAMAISLIIILQSIEELTEYLTDADEAKWVTFATSLGVMLTTLAIICAVVAGIGKSLTNKNVAKGFLAISLFMAILVGFVLAITASIKIISNASLGTIISGGAIILLSLGGLFVGIIFLLKELTAIAGKDAEKRVGHVKSLLTFVGGFILVIAILALSIAASLKILSGVTWDKIVVSGLALLVFMGTIGAAIYGLIKVLEKIKKSQLETVKDTILSISILIGVVGIALAAMALVTKDREWAVVASAAAIAIVVAAILGMLILFNKVQKAVTPISIGILVSLAIVIGAVAYSLYELSKVNTTVIWSIVGALVVLIGAVSFIVGALASFASTGAGAVAIMLAEAAIGVAAAFAYALSIVIDKLTDLLIVIGVMAYGPEFAGAIATAFSTKSIGVFGDAVNTVSGTVKTATDNMAGYFGGLISPIQSVIDKTKELLESDIDVGEWIKKALNDPAIFGVSWDTPDWYKWLEKKDLEAHPWREYMTDDVYNYYKNLHPGHSLSDEEIIQIVKDKKYTAVNEQRVQYSAKQAELERANRQEEIRKEVLDAYEENIKRFGTLNERQAKAAKQAEDERKNRSKVIEEELKDLDRIKLLNSTTEEATKAIDEYYEKLGTTEEAGKQGAINFTDSFVGTLGDLFNGSSNEYTDMLGNIGSNIGASLGTDISLGNVSLGDFTDISMLSDYMGTDDIVGSINGLTDNQAIMDIQSNQGANNNLLNQLLGLQQLNNSNTNDILGYLQTISNNGEGTVNAINGMGVYIDKDILVGNILPNINTGLNQINIGSLRGQHG